MRLPSRNGSRNTVLLRPVSQGRYHGQSGESLSAIKGLLNRLDVGVLGMAHPTLDSQVDLASMAPEEWKRAMSEMEVRHPYPDLAP
jgi:hypothetical protein